MELRKLINFAERGRVLSNQPMALVACNSLMEKPIPLYMSAGHLKVKIFGPQGNQTVPVAKSTLTVGSAVHCDIVLDHPSVMPEHVRAWLDGGRIWIQDLGGTSGTTLNGIRLPILKPMLVRDLDVLKLGDCPATLGLEANLVRAPVVKTQIPLDEITATDFRPFGGKSESENRSQEEVENLRREVADLKLQLQMGRSGGANADGEELRKLNEQRQKLAETVARLEQEKQLYRKNLEQEIADLKLKALRELKEQKENELRKFEIWKAETVVDLNKNFRQLTHAKAKAWATRPLSQDMVFEWEADLNQIVRRVVLNDHNQDAPEIRAKVSSGVYEQTQTSITKTTISAQTDPKVKAQAKTVKVTPPKPVKEALIRYLLMGLGSSCLVAFVYLNLPFFKRAINSRLANQPAPIQKVEQASVTAQPMVAQRRAAAVPAPVRYELKQSKGFRKTYAENILYTLNFEEAEMNSDFRRKWISDLTKVAKTWKVEERTVGVLVGKEMQFILDLKRMKEVVNSDATEREALVKMQQREAAFVQDIEGVLKSKPIVDKFLKYKRSFFLRNSQYLVRQVR